MNNVIRYIYDVLDVLAAAAAAYLHGEPPFPPNLMSGVKRVQPAAAAATCGQKRKAIDDIGAGVTCNAGSKTGSSSGNEGGHAGSSLLIA